MPAYRILKEQPVPKDKWTDDLSSHSEFLPTGAIFFCTPDKAQARVEQLQADGGCYSLQMLQQGEKP